MSNLSREECLEALDSIEEETTFVEDYGTMPFITCNHLQKEISILRQLINEHFKCDRDCRNCWKFKIVEKCNPPLEYLDIEEGDWIWNNASKEYIKVLNKYVHQGKGMLVIKNHLRSHPEEIRFVEGRFYRKQVEE